MTRTDMAIFALCGTALILAAVAAVEWPLSILLGASYTTSLVRGLALSALIAPPILWLIAMNLQRNAKLARRYRAALRLANRNASALEEKNEELEITRLRLAEIANSDFLTGLANRRRFEEALVRAFSDAEAGQLDFALHLLDLNRFKQINDTHGHDAGDAVLRHTSVRIRKALAERDGLAARLGGDEFAVLVWDTDDQADLQQFSRNLAALIAEPQGYCGEILQVTATVSSSLYSSDFSSASQMFIATDQRLISLKKPNDRRRAAARTLDAQSIAV